MKAALLSFALLGSSALAPVSDRVPELNVDALCRATVATDKAMGLSESQSLADCTRDEQSALLQLRTVWPQAASSIRDNCEGEAASAGSQSYVDLLTCIQMAQWANAKPVSTGLRGASKSRNGNLAKASN